MDACHPPLESSQSRWTSTGCNGDSLGLQPIGSPELTYSTPPRTVMNHGDQYIDGIL
ncbi:hypothetical protein BC939DRAFT_506718 [Gamsiella multidivaricata]|uniref:uncharacterized protein n=1 Tax=Gamsiella multidivaricata TaxID=101098 RepID=UPI002220A452|nr:uncharacterized protein BC939DRAFT_506718 [Gamsiella multidivaricata]KAI7818210.1 hypothetical protein BC939DRAFT_506718 [Gamsiella multidivaricata]